MTDTARALLVAALLSGSGFAAYAWRLVRTDAADPHRLIGELRLSQWAALTLAVVGGAWLGAATGRPAIVAAGVDVTIAFASILLAAWTLQRDTRQSLLVLSAAFVVHALLDTAHRPGWLAADLAPRWFIVGCAAYNVYMAALCYWAQRR